MQSFFDRTPWEQQQFCGVPVETVVTLNSQVNVQLVNGDPMRFFLLIAAYAVAAGGGQVSTNPAAGGNSGIQMNNTTLPLVITASTYGPLVTLPWYGSAKAPNSMTLTIITQSFIRDPYDETYTSAIKAVDNAALANGPRLPNGNGKYNANGNRWRESAQATIDDIAAAIQSYQCGAGWQRVGNDWLPPSNWRRAPHPRQQPLRG